MGIRSRRAASQAEARAYYGTPAQGSRVPSSRVYAGNGTLGPNVKSVLVTPRSRIGNQWSDLHSVKAIYRDGTGSRKRGSRSIARSEASPVRSTVGTIRYGSGLQSVGLAQSQAD